MVTFLSGGTGTPKVLWGAADIFPREDTTVIANTGDDIELGGLHVSPDCDTVLYERAGLLDRDTWWGVANDSTVTNEMVSDLVASVDLPASPRYRSPDEQTEGRTLSRWRRFAGVPEFMTLGDRDRAHHMVRTALLEAGHSLTEATKQLTEAHDLTIDLLPMSDDPVATLIHTPHETIHFQEYWVARRGEPTVTDVTFRGGEHATATPEVRQALAAPVVIGPSNPVTSLGPMLALQEVAEALHDTPVVAVSPFVGETVFSGPAADLMRGTGRDPSTQGVAEALPMADAFVLDVNDETALDRPVVRTDTHIETQADAHRVAMACADALAEVT